MNDTYLYLIIALLPLTAGMLVTQTNPYHALIIRGVLGAVAAMVDAVLGAADVALTEALMGTMLSITLYAIAVRSSLVLRLGVMENQSIEKNQDSNFQQLINDFRSIFPSRLNDAVFKLIYKVQGRFCFLLNYFSQTIHSAESTKDFVEGCIPINY
jgi:uncharacterized MnhB-related membrane protein